MRPILKKFFSLPITPTSSCYGHVDTEKNPYLSFVDDEARNESEHNIQKRFKEGIGDLEVQINQAIGSDTVKLSLEEFDHGGGPLEYTLRFEIADKMIFRAEGDKLLSTIWDEFVSYLNDLR
jgi:hypothetical protein